MKTGVGNVFVFYGLSIICLQPFFISDASFIYLRSLLGMQRSMRRSSSSTVVIPAIILCCMSRSDDSARTQTYSTVPCAVTWLTVYRALQVEKRSAQTAISSEIEHQFFRNSFFIKLFDFLRLLICLTFSEK